MMAFDELPVFDYAEVVAGDALVFLRNNRDKPLFRLRSAKTEENLLVVAEPGLIRKVINSPEMFSSTNHPQAIRFDSDVNAETSCIYAKGKTNLKNIAVWSDGAQHSRVRKLIQFAFSTAQVNAKTARIQMLVDGLLDEIARAGRVDFIPAYAHRLPTMVITHELGLEPGDVKLVREVTDHVSAMMDTSFPIAFAASAAPSIVRLHETLLERLAAPEGLRPNSILANVVEAKVDGEEVLTREETLWLATLLLAAGGHTTGAVLGWIAHTLATDPALQQRLRTDPAGIDTFVEEVLRVHNPVRSHYRRVTQDTALGETTIPAGTFVTMRFDNVNFDGAKFHDPFQFDMDRADVSRHFTFGTGPHFCIGNLLARRELALTTAGLLARFSRIGLDEAGGGVHFLKSFDFHVIEELPMIFETK